jgi:hypothetical protein
MTENSVAEDESCASIGDVDDPFIQELKKECELEQAAAKKEKENYWEEQLNKVEKGEEPAESEEEPATAVAMASASTASPDEATKASAKKKGIEKDVTIDEAPQIVKQYQRKEVSRGTVRKFFLPYLFNRATSFNFAKSAAFLVIAKSIGIASPFLLKNIVNSLTVAFGTVGASTVASGAAVAAGAFSLKKTIWTVGLWGWSRIFSAVFLCWQMDSVTAGIQKGIRKVASASFDHQLDLDLYYHKQGSKNTVFEINRALRSLDQGLRFFLGFFA